MKKKHRIWLDNFLKNCRFSNKSDYTIDNYRCDIQQFIKWFEQNNKSFLNDAKASTITEYKDYISGHLEVKSPPRFSFIRSIKRVFSSVFSRKDNKNNTIEVDEATKKLSISSRRRHLSAIKNFYEYLKQSNEDHNKLFSLNPVKSKLHHIKLKEQDIEPTKLLTRKDWENIELSPLSYKELLIVNLLYYGGLRLSELCYLKKSAFNYENGSITFTRKGGYVHTLYPQKRDELFQMLDNYIKGIPESLIYIFPAKSGNRPITSRTMYSLILKIFKKCHCSTPGLTPHSFRKACASNLYSKTKDLLFVRDYLNHSDAKVTQTYIERIDSDQSKLANLD